MGGWGYCVPQLGVDHGILLLLIGRGVKIFYIKKKGVA